MYVPAGKLVRTGCYGKPKCNCSIGLDAGEPRPRTVQQFGVKSQYFSTYSQRAMRRKPVYQGGSRSGANCSSTEDRQRRVSIVEVLVIVVFVAVVVYALRSGQSGPPPAPERPSPPAPADRQGKPKPFDAESARHLDQERVLIGRAWIVDGDTIIIKKTQVRLFGIDAPEHDHPHGRNAKWALHRLCKGNLIRAEITDKDAYSRTVARCYLPDGRDLSAEMVKLGLAIDWPKFSGGRYTDLEPHEARKKLFLADARQKGRMHVWAAFEAKRRR